MQRMFFATADDLLPVFERVEKRHGLAYTLRELAESAALTKVFSGAAIPTLRAPAPAPNAICGHPYLATPADVSVLVREVPQVGGGVRYTFDQVTTPDSVEVTPGGFYRDDILLYGRVATISTTPFSKQVYRAFASAIAARFRRVRAFYVGPQAAKFWRGGCRLTIGADSPIEYDLAA
jgi:hypothetical protein